ncbi:MAG TPA: CusA/CzcA family heavy metal efflux RND transporter [Candidatus Acidoferrales bacterium]|nr:CusA/CzcA family heavy metal efflux RND transporter [Candidatus Acidoferrales bacterium]
MVKRIVSFSLDQPLFVGLLAVLFIFAGILAFRSLPIEAFPDVTDVQVTIISLFPGHAPEEVEKQVTMPLEIELSGLPHAVRMFSHTQFGLSFIIITFDDQVTDYFVRQQVAERLQGVDLPQGVQPQLAPLSTAIGEIYRYRVKGNGVSATDLRSIQDWDIARYLKLTPGVADVVSFGGFIKQYQVNLDLAKLQFNKVTLQQVFTALGRGNANAGGSYIEQGEQQYLVRGIGLLRSKDDINNIVVAERNGTPLLMRDVADVTVSAVPRQGIVGQDEDDDIVTGLVLMRKGENPSEVLAALKERVAHLNESVLPKNVQIVPFYDRTWLIGTTLKTVFTNLIEGALLVTVVLYVFLGNLRSAGIVAVIIPLSLLATFIGLKLRGIAANLLSLGAMDFGIIVDGAVIVVENVFRHLSEPDQNRDLQSIKETIRAATVEVGRPTLFSMIIIITAHIPIFALQRHEGRIFAPMAYTVTSALVGSLLFSLTLVPLLCYFFLRRNLPETENWLLRNCKSVYHRLLIMVLHNRKIVIVSAVAALVFSLVLAPRLGTEFLPELNEGALWINITLPPGISVSEATRECARIRAAVRRFPEVNSVISKAGRPEDGTDPKAINMAEFLVDLKPASAWTRKITKEQLITQIERALNDIPGIEPSFSQPIRDNILESISQIDGQIVVKVFGPETAAVQNKAREVLATISGVRGVARAFIDRVGEVPQLQIDIDRQRAARYGLNVSDIQDVIETAIGGKSATEIWEGEKRFQVVTRLGEEARNNIGAIRNVLIDTPAGSRVRLDQVAAINVQGGSLNISRESGMRVAAVSVFIRGRDMGSVVEDMQQRVKSKVTFPPGYFVAWSGEFENQQRAMARLRLVVPLSVFLIFILLFNAFNSVKSALLILLNVPFALIGGILALFLTGIPLSVSAAIGFIALFGQAVLNGVVMVSYFNQLRDSDPHAFQTVVGDAKVKLTPVTPGAQKIRLLDAVVVGSLLRLRTVLMTALLAMLGLLPMALSHGIGSEVQKPLAVVIIGGLVSATLLTLIVLPTLYIVMEEWSGGGHEKTASETI